MLENPCLARDWKSRASFILLDRFSGNRFSFLSHSAPVLVRLFSQIIRNDQVIEWAAQYLVFGTAEDCCEFRIDTYDSVLDIQ